MQTPRVELPVARERNRRSVRRRHVRDTATSQGAAQLRQRAQPWDVRPGFFANSGGGGIGCEAADPAASSGGEELAGVGDRKEGEVADGGGD